jgi:hypothetical protein
VQCSAVHAVGLAQRYCKMLETSSAIKFLELQNQGLGI